MDRTETSVRHRFMGSSSQATACLYDGPAGVPDVNHNTGSGNNSCFFACSRGGNRLLPSRQPFPVAHGRNETGDTALPSSAVGPGCVKTRLYEIHRELFSRFLTSWRMRSALAARNKRSCPDEC